MKHLAFAALLTITGWGLTGCTETSSPTEIKKVVPVTTSFTVSVVFVSPNGATRGAHIVTTLVQPGYATTTRASDANGLCEWTQVQPVNSTVAIDGEYVAPTHEIQILPGPNTIAVFQKVAPTPTPTPVPGCYQPDGKPCVFP